METQDEVLIVDNHYIDKTDLYRNGQIHFHWDI
jgi:hypothetical protein